MANIEHNPANSRGQEVTERTRIPMDTPTLKLQVPEIPGYRLYWFRGEPARISRAERAGYEFVRRDEIEVNSVGIADDRAADGNTDMGSLVSVSAGDLLGEDKQPLKMILMKIREEWAQADDAVKAERNDAIAAALRGGLIGSEKDSTADRGARYLDPSRTKIPDMFMPKHARG